MTKFVHLQNEQGDFYVTCFDNGYYIEYTCHMNILTYVKAAYELKTGYSNLTKVTDTSIIKILNKFNNKNNYGCLNCFNCQNCEFCTYCFGCIGCGLCDQCCNITNTWCELNEIC